MERKNTVTVKSFELGLSSLLDARSKTLVVEQTDFWNRMGEECNYQVTENSAASVRITPLFFYDPDFDQSKEMYAAVGRHFNRYLSS